MPWLFQYPPLPFHRSYKMVTCHGYLKNHQSYIEKLPKNWKNDPFSGKKWNFQKVSKVFNLLWYKILSTQTSHS